MKSITITTTDTIEGCKITGYIDIVRYSMVVGTDIALTNLFISTSKKYSNQLNEIYEKAMQYLRLKGMAIGADAIVGLHTDFEEIFGKGIRKFVVSLIGTAVTLDNTPDSCDNTQENTVSRVYLQQQQLLLNLRRKFSDINYAPDEDDWENIIKYSLHDLAPYLYKRYLILSKETISSTPLAEKKLLLDNFIIFMQSMDYDNACDVVYSDITTSPFGTCEVVEACHLFNPSKIVELLSPENKHIVISLLNADKDYYDMNDLSLMKKIEVFLDNLPDTGHYEEGKGSLFGKSGTLLVCERGHTTAVELGGHCTKMLEDGLGICNLNVKGITEAEVQAIVKYKEKIEILSANLIVK